MPNQRDKSKVFIGGYFDRPLAAGVGIWLKRQPNKRMTASDFLHAAIIEKLDREGIEVPTRQKTSFGSNLPEEAFAEVRERPNSSLEGAAEAGAKKAADSVERSGVVYGRRRKVASTTGKTS